MWWLFVFSVCFDFTLSVYRCDAPVAWKCCRLCNIPLVSFSLLKVLPRGEVSIRFPVKHLEKRFPSRRWKVGLNGFSNHAKSLLYRFRHRQSLTCWIWFSKALLFPWPVRKKMRCEGRLALELLSRCAATRTESSAILRDKKKTRFRRPT